MKRRDHPMRRRQRGLALIVVMIVLAVVMVLGVGGAQIALLGERSTRFDRDYLVASQAAEAALMDAEFDIRGPNNFANNRVALFSPSSNGGTLFVPGCGAQGTTSEGLCQPSNPSVTTKPVWAASTTDFIGGTNTVTFGDFTGRSYVSALTNGAGGIQPALPPRYIIEVVPDTAPSNGVGSAWMYRITAMGFGPRQEVQVVLQTAFRKEH